MSDHITWPIVWRVVAPACGNWGSDMVFLETDSEAVARKEFKMHRKSLLPVRLERVSCGPLPKDAVRSIPRLQAAVMHNPGKRPRKILGFWTQTGGHS